jgi:ribose 5-phosphate isomerase A
MANDSEKEAAARASLRFVKDGQVVGLGTGSTAAYFIKLLAEQVTNGLAVRMAVLFLLNGGKGPQEIATV